MRTSKSQLGFSLLELLVASSIGLIVLLAMTSLFKTGMDTTFTVTQRAETQQNMRAAIELITKDLSLAGAGLPSGGDGRNRLQVRLQPDRHLLHPWRNLSQQRSRWA